MFRRNCRGLTLVEVLVAMAILALLSLLAYRAMDATLRARDGVAAEADRWRTLAFFFDRLRDDVDQLASRGPRVMTTTRAPAWNGTGSTLELASFGPDGAALRRTGYRWRDGEIELLLWPVFDAAPNTAPEIHSLVSGVRSLQLRYLNNARAWTETWAVPGAAAEPPRALRVELVLADGTVVSRVFATPR